MADDQCEDLVNHPCHYERNGKQCIVEIKRLLTPEEYRGFLKGNAIKYIWRYPYKWDPPQDLNKAGWYVDKLIHDCPSVPYTPYQHAWSLNTFDARKARSQYVSAQESLENMIECGIEAVGHDDYLIANGWLSQMEEHLYLVDKMKNENQAIQNAKGQKMADKKDDISDHMTPEELKVNINSIFGAKAQTKNDSESVRENSHASHILSAMKWLAANQREIWSNAWWFNYDPIIHEFHVKSYIFQVGDSTKTYVDVFLRYVGTDEWRLQIKTASSERAGDREGEC